MADCASAFFLFCSSSSFTRSSLTRLVSLFGSSSWEALAASSRQSGGGGVDGLPLVGIAKPLPSGRANPLRMADFGSTRSWLSSAKLRHQDRVSAEHGVHHIISRAPAWPGPYILQCTELTCFASTPPVLYE